MKDPNQIITVDEKTGRVSVVTVNKEPSKTQQQYKDECDVNNIMKRYQQTGEIHHLNRSQGVYADLSEIKDYQSMLNTVLAAQETFEALPANVRARFENNPAKLIEFVQDTKNLDEGIKLGIFEPKHQTPNATNEPKNDNAQGEPKK